MSEFVTIDIVTSRGHDSIYINDHRIAGSKPWGGGTILKSFKVKRSSLEKDLAEAMKIVDHSEDEQR